MRTIRLLALATGVLLLAPRPMQAQVPGYKIQSVAKIGDTIGDLKIGAGSSFRVCSLNDSGQLVFVAENAAGGEILFQYRSSDGKFVPIVVGGRDAPGGKWPRDVGIWTPVQTNQQGDMVFQATSSSGSLNTYRWDHQSGQVSIVAAQGMPAVNDLTFTAGGDLWTPAINDYGEVAFQAMVQDSAGKTQRALFFLGRDSKLVSVLLPGQTVDGVGTIEPSPQSGHLTVNNVGVIGFRARRTAVARGGIFTWENGTITPVVLAGGEAPGGGEFVFLGDWGIVNNKNRNVLFFGNLDGNPAHWGLFGRIDGHLVTVAAPGQEMPGGGRFGGSEGIPDGGSGGSVPSSAGEIVLAARLEGGDIGAYRIDADGKLWLVVRSSDLGGKIVDPPNGMAINGKGQVALPMRFTGDKVDTLVLLTPVSP